MFILKSKYIILILTGLFTILNIYPQRGKAKIENVDFSYNEETQMIIVMYDITNYAAIERFTIELVFVDFNNNYYYPKSTRGDVGNGITGGKNKVIYWDVLRDVDQLGRVMARVHVKGVTEELGGASNALWSVLIPGLGDYKVKNKKKMIFKPALRTVLTFGLVGYGLYSKSQALKFDEQYWNAPQAERQNFDNLYNKANTANHRFYIAAGAGLALWASDVIWVAAQG